MAKITKHEAKSEIIVRTKDKSKTERVGAWWNAPSKQELAETLIGTATFLKEKANMRYRQAAIFARLYSNMPLFGFLGNNLVKMGGMVESDDDMFLSMPDDNDELDSPDAPPIDKAKERIKRVMGKRK